MTDGSLLPLGQSLTHGIYVETDYAFTNRLSVTFGVPYVFAKYTGDGPTPAALPVDMCRCWHSSWQDFGITARVNLINGLFALTPFVSAGLPSHAYNYQGEAVVGRALKELRVGVAAGRRLDEISPRLSVQGSYSYAIVEEVLEVPNNRTNVSVDGGVEVLARRLFVRSLFLWQRTHGGLRAGTGPPVVPWGEITTQELFDQHDRLLRDNNFRVGIGVSGSLARADLYATFIGYVSGTDSHAGHAITVGISLPFTLGGRN